jgi:hypothetical protein
MVQASEDCVDVKVDIGILQTQVSTLTTLCSKMDTVIEKLVDQHDRHIAKVYTDMDNRRLETESDIKEIHDRIDVVLDKMHSSELRITGDIKALREEMLKRSKYEESQLEKLNQWKWMTIGAIMLLMWLISRESFDIMKGIFIH